MSFSGITKKLSALFWPDYRYTQSERSCLYDKTRQGAKGLQRGREGDSAVSALVRKQTVRVSASSARDASLVMRAVGALGLRARDTQVYVRVPELRIHTWIDIAAVDGNGDVVLVEQKIGYNNGSWETGNASMRHELAFCTNSPLNQAFAQLAVSCFMYEYSRRTRVKAAYVIHVSDRGVGWHILPLKFRVHAEAVVRRIGALAQMNQGQTDKRRSRCRGAACLT